VIASARGLVVLAALVVALLVIALVDHPHAAAVDRALAPGLDLDRLDTLEIGSAHLRRAGEHWQTEWGRADAAAVDAILSALRGARWHRRADKSVAGPPRATLRAGAATIAIGRALPGTAQTWLAIGDHAYLVDDWVATALAPAPLALVERHPLAAAASARELSFSGGPRLRLHGGQRVEPQALWLDPARVVALEEACAALEIVELAQAAPASGPAIRLAHPDAVVEVAGVCAGDRVRVIGTTIGCVERAAWQRVVEAATALAGDPAPIVDRRPLPIAPTTLAFGGKPIDLRRDVDAEAAAALLAALAAPAEVVPRPPGKPASTIVADTITLELYAGVLARAGEPVALRPSREAWAIIARGAAALRDPTRWREDPLTITSITLDLITYTRGAVIGEWQRKPAGKIDGALVDALVESVASLRAPTGPAPASIAHRISFTVTPPAGKPATHAIELATGCAGRADHEPVALPLALCTAAAALAAGH